MHIPVGYLLTVTGKDGVGVPGLDPEMSILTTTKNVTTQHQGFQTILATSLEPCLSPAPTTVMDKESA